MQGCCWHWTFLVRVVFAAVEVLLAPPPSLRSAATAAAATSPLPSRCQHHRRRCHGCCPPPHLAKVEHRDDAVDQVKRLEARPVCFEWWRRRWTTAVYVCVCVWFVCLIVWFYAREEAASSPSASEAAADSTAQQCSAQQAQPTKCPAPALLARPRRSHCRSTSAGETTRNCDMTTGRGAAAPAAPRCCCRGCARKGRRGGRGRSGGGGGGGGEAIGARVYARNDWGRQ